MKGQIPLEDHPVKAGSSRCDVAVELRQKLAGKTHDVLPVPRNRKQLHRPASTVPRHVVFFKHQHTAALQNLWSVGEAHVRSVRQSIVTSSTFARRKIALSPSERPLLFVERS